jgi:hypothetical protein
MSKRAFNHSYGWGPRLRLRRPTCILVIKCTALLTCIENSYCIHFFSQERFFLNVLRTRLQLISQIRQFHSQLFVFFLLNHDARYERHVHTKCSKHLLQFFGLSKLIFFCSGSHQGVHRGPPFFRQHEITSPKIDFFCRVTL